MQQKIQSGFSNFLEKNEPGTQQNILLNPSTLINGENQIAQKAAHKNKPNNVLRYGQVIQMQCSYSNGKHGLLHSKGWTNKDVSIMEIQMTECIPNTRESFFRILPKGQFYIHDEYQKVSSEEKVLLEERLRRELVNYEKLCEMKLGTSVDLGSEVILQHLDSISEYLSGTEDCPSDAADSYQLKIKPLLKTANLFKIVSANSFDIDGDQILFHQEIFLQHVKTGYYLDASNAEKKQHLAFKKNLVEMNPSIEEYVSIKVPEDHNKRFLSILTCHKDTIWSFNLIYESDYREDDDKIYNYELVQIIHNRQDSVLSQCDQSNQLILKRGTITPTSSPSQMYDSLFEICSVQDKPNLFRLRHFISGKMVTCSEIQPPQKESKHEQNKVQILEHSNDDSQVSSASNLAKDQINENPLDSQSHQNTFLNGFPNKQLFSPKKENVISEIDYQSESNNERHRTLVSHRIQLTEKDHTSSKSLDFTKRTGQNKLLQRANSFVKKLSELTGSKHNINDDNKDHPGTQSEKIARKNDHSLWKMTLMMKEKYQTPGTQYYSPAKPLFTGKTNSQLTPQSFSFEAAAEAALNVSANNTNHIMIQHFPTAPSAGSPTLSFEGKVEQIEELNDISNKHLEDQNQHSNDEHSLGFELTLEGINHNASNQNLEIKQVIRNTHKDEESDEDQQGQTANPELTDRSINHHQITQTSPVFSHSPCFVKFLQGELELVELHHEGEPQNKVAESLSKGSLQQPKLQASTSIQSNETSQFFKQTISINTNSSPQKPAKATLDFDTQIEEMVRRQKCCAETINSHQQCLFAKKKSRNGFRIIKVERKTQLLMLWALSAQEQLHSFTSLLYISNELEVLRQYLTQKTIKTMIKCLRELNAKLESGPTTGETGGSQSLWENVSIIQKILVESKIGFQVVFLLYSLSYTRDIIGKFKDNEAIWSQLMNLLRLCYVLLKNIVRGNQQTKLLISQNLELFIRHAFAMQNELPIQIFLSELFYDNYKSISNLITAESIQNIISQIYKSPYPHPIHSKILSAVTQCNQSAVTENQNCVIQHFFNQRKSYPQFHFYFRHRNSKENTMQSLKFIDSSQETYLFIRCQLEPTVSPKLMTIQQLQNASSNKNDSQRMFKYFISYIDLLANICSSRNKIGKDLVESILTIDQIIYILENNSNILTGSAKTPFLKLLQHAFIDVSDTYVIPKILKVREWKLIREQTGINRSQNIRHIEEIQKILNYILQFFIVNTELSPTDDSKNVEILTMLEMFKQATDLGIQTNLNVINQFVPILISILKSEGLLMMSNQTKSNTAKTTEEPMKGNVKLQINFTIVQKCKQMITSILQEYMDIQVNIHLSIVLRQFQEYFETNEQNPSIIQPDMEKVAERWILFLQNSGISSQTQNLSISNEQLSSEKEMKSSESLQAEAHEEIKSIQEIQGLNSIDLTLMRQMIAKNNTSILDSLLHLLKRIFSQKQELFSSFQKIILVKGGLAEQISQNIPRFRLSIEKLKDLHFLNELNVPLVEGRRGNDSTSLHQQATQIQASRILQTFQREQSIGQNMFPQSDQIQNDEDDMTNPMRSSESTENSQKDTRLAHSAGFVYDTRRSIKYNPMQMSSEQALNKISNYFGEKRRSNLMKDKMAKIFRQYIKQNGPSSSQANSDDGDSTPILDNTEEANSEGSKKISFSSASSLVLRKNSEILDNDTKKKSNFFEMQQLRKRGSNLVEITEKDQEDEQKLKTEQQPDESQTESSKPSEPLLKSSSSISSDEYLRLRYRSIMKRSDPTKKGWMEIRIRAYNYLEFLMADLSQLTSFMKEGFELKSGTLELQEVLSKDSYFFSFNFHENPVKSFVHERVLNNRLIQNLIRSHDLHPTILKYLSNVDIPSINVKIENLLFSIYEFLTVMVWNNHEAKMELISAKQIALDHVSLNCGALEFLKELYTNVKMLLLNQTEIMKVSSTILKIFNESSKNQLFQSKLLLFLKTLLVVNDKPIKVNQRIIFEAIQSRYYNLNLLNRPAQQEQILKDLPEMTLSFQKQLDQCFSGDPISLDFHPQIAYLISLMSLLEHLTEGNKHAELRKRRKLHSFKFLVQLAKASGTHIPLKKEIRGYINRVFYRQQVQKANDPAKNQNIFDPSTPKAQASTNTAHPKIVPKSKFSSTTLQSDDIEHADNEKTSLTEVTVDQQTTQASSNTSKIQQIDRSNNQLEQANKQQESQSSMLSSKINSRLTNSLIISEESSEIISQNKIKPSIILDNNNHSSKELNLKAVDSFQSLQPQTEEQVLTSEELKTENTVELTTLNNETLEDVDGDDSEKEEYDTYFSDSEQNEEELEKRQQGLEANREQFKREIQQFYFSDFKQSDSNVQKEIKKSIFEKEDMMEDAIEDLQSMSRDLQEYLSLLEKDLILEEIQINNFMRFKYLKSYALLNFKEIVTSLYYLFTNSDFISLLKNSLEYQLKNNNKITHNCLIDIVHSLISIGKISRYLHVPLKIVMRKLYQIIKTFDFKILQQNYSGTSVKPEDTFDSLASFSKMHESELISPLPLQLKNISLDLGMMNHAFKEITDKNDQIQKEEDQKEVLNRIKSFVRLYDSPISESKSTMSNKMFRRSQTNKIEDSNELLNNQLKYELYAIDNSEEFKDYLNNQSMKLFQTVWSTDGKSSQNDQNTAGLSKKHFIQSLLDTALSNPNLKDDLHIFNLKILIQFIKEENPAAKEEKEEIDVWETTFWKNNKDGIEKMQNMIYNFGGAKLICNLLKQPNLEQRLNLVSHVLLFGISLLLGGHHKTQNRILQILSEDIENTILMNILKLIQKVGKIVYRFTKEKLKSQDQAGFVSIDTYDYYSRTEQAMLRKNTKNPDDYREEHFQKLCIEVLKRIFRFLQLCCEDNNVETKNFLRQQVGTDRRNKPNSINFIQVATKTNRDFLNISSAVKQSIIKFFESLKQYDYLFDFCQTQKTILDIPNFITDFLIEVTQVPCLENQISLCQTSFFEDISLLSQILDNKTEENKDEDSKELGQFYSKVMQLALVVLEGTDKQIYAEVMSKISTEFLWIIVRKHFKEMKVNTVEVLKKYINENEVDGYFDEHVMEILQVLTVLRRLGEYQSDIQTDFFNSAQEEEQELLTYLDSCIATIEIADQKHCKPVYFPFAPLYGCLSQALRYKIMKQVNRETQRDKIMDLLEFKELVFDEMLHNYQLSKNSIPATGSNVHLIQKIVTNLSLFINAYLLVSTTVSLNQQHGMMISFNMNYSEMHIWLLSCIFGLLVIVFIVFTAINQVPLKQTEAVLQGFQQTVIPKVLHILSHDQLPSLLLLLLSAVLAIFIHPKFIVISLPYSFSKLRLVQGTLENLYSALFMQMKQLLLVSFLGVLFLYIFSVISFDNYFSEIYSEKDFENEGETCNSLISCMITLTLSGVVGDGMTHWEMSTFFSDTLYFIFVSILFSNIISGIMTDTFAEMRDNRNFMETDKKNFCYICGITRTTLEKQEQTFEEHIKKHSLWEYLFYIYSLKIKEETEYTGIEYMITDKLEKQDISWIPNNSHLNA